MTVEALDGDMTVFAGNQVVVKEIPEDAMDLSFLTYAAFHRIGIVEVRGSDRQDSLDRPILEAVIDSPIESDLAIVSELEEELLRTPIGQTFADVTLGNYEVFMPQRYLVKRVIPENQHREIDALRSMRAFMTAYLRHLDLRMARASKEDPRKLINRLGLIDFDKDAERYFRQLQMHGVPPYSTDEMGYLINEQLEYIIEEKGLSF